MSRLPDKSLDFASLRSSSSVSFASHSMPTASSQAWTGLLSRGTGIAQLRFLGRVAVVVATLVAGVVCSVVPGTLFAQSKPAEDIHFIWGATFIGTPEQQRAATPYLLELNKDERFQKQLDKRLGDAVLGMRFKSGHRIQTDLASVQGDTFALSFAVTGERVEVERVGGSQFNIQYRLRAMVLVINLSVKPENRRIVAIHTVPVTYLTVGDRPPSQQEILGVFRSLYLEAPAGVDVLAAWLKVAT